MDKQITVVGDCSIDHFLFLDAKGAGIIHPDTNHEKICFNYGEKLPVSRTATYFGGSALNVSASLSTLGMQTKIVTFLGHDIEAHEIIGFFHNLSINTDLVKFDKSTNQSFILIFDEERTVLSNHLERSYSSLKIETTDYIYLASCGKGSDDMINQIRSAVSRGSKLIFNPGSYILRNFDLFKPLIPISSIFILNKQEAEDLFPEGSITAQLEKILSFGTKLAVITDGSSGAYFGQDGKYYHMNSLAAEIKDPTGAGDAFAGGLVAGLANENSLEEAAKWGMVNAASVIEQEGANTGVLGLDEIEDRLQRSKVLNFSEL